MMFSLYFDYFGIFVLSRLKLLYVASKSAFVIPSSFFCKTSFSFEKNVMLYTSSLNLWLIVCYLYRFRSLSFVCGVHSCRSARAITLGVSEKEIIATDVVGISLGASGKWIGSVWLEGIAATFLNAEFEDWDDTSAYFPCLKAICDPKARLFLNFKLQLAWYAGIFNVSRNINVHFLSSMFHSWGESKLL